MVHDLTDEEKQLIRLYELYEQGICWECHRQLMVDFRNPDEDNWVEASCPSCSYRTHIPRGI